MAFPETLFKQRAKGQLQTAKALWEASFIIVFEREKWNPSRKGMTSLGLASVSATRGGESRGYAERMTVS